MQYETRVLHKFVPNEWFGQLLHTSTKKNRILKTFNLEFSDTEVWFTDQNSKPLDIEDKINMTLVINQSRRHKN